MENKSNNNGIHELLIAMTIQELKDTIRKIIREELQNISKEPETTDNSEYLTRDQVADKFHFSLVTLNRLTKNGTLRSYRIGGRVLYKTDEIKQSVTEQNKNYRR